MTKSIARTIGSIAFFSAGLAIIFLERGAHLSDTFANTVLAVLMIAAIASYYVIGHVYKERETADYNGRTAAPNTQFEASWHAGSSHSEKNREM